MSSLAAHAIEIQPAVRIAFHTVVFSARTELPETRNKWEDAGPHVRLPRSIDRSNGLQEIPTSDQ